MGLDNLSSPHKRSQTPFSSSSFRKQLAVHELGGWSTLFERHRFLLTTLVLLLFLCTIYLYFAVTLGSTGSSCLGKSASENALCQLRQTKLSVYKGKLKFF